MSRVVAAPRRRVARQLVRAENGDVVGYELLFGVDQDGAPEQIDLRRSQAITAAFAHLAQQHLGARRALFVNATRAFLTGALPVPFSAQNAVLEVLDDVEVDDQVLAGVTALRERGYRVAVDGWAQGPAIEALLAIADFVRVDVRQVEPGSLVELVAYVREVAGRAQVMAAAVDDEAAWVAARAAGFDLFEGDHLQRSTGPASVSTPSQLVALRLLAALSDPTTTPTEVEGIVSADPALTLKVLGVAGSAAGAGRPIGSLRQAVVLVGRRVLGSWVVLAALQGRSGGGREEMIEVLTLARTCELLAPVVEGTSPADAYAAGLVVAMGRVLGADVAAVLRGTRLDPGVAAAVLEGRGPLAVLLEAVAEFDRNGTTGGATLSAAQVAQAHLQALAAAMASVDDLED
jgi:c-di-GMP-related signal transduction protein